MQIHRSALFVLTVFAVAFAVAAQEDRQKEPLASGGPAVAIAPGVITTYAGTGTNGYNGDGGQASSAELSYPESAAVDPSGNIVVVDSGNDRVRRINPSTGIITTIAGIGPPPGNSGDGGPATSAELYFPEVAAWDPAGNLYFTDTLNNRIRKVTASTGIISTVAGNGTKGYSGDGGPATSAEINNPNGVTFDSSGNLYIGDTANQRIRKVNASTGVITTIAGNGTAGYSGDNGPATGAELYQPSGVVVDADGNVLVADFYNNRVRRIAAGTGMITTIAGGGATNGDGIPATSAKLCEPWALAFDGAGDLYICDTCNWRFRMVSAATGLISTIAGNGTKGFAGDNGPATSAEFNFPSGMEFDAAGNLYLADTYNYRVRKVTAAGSPLNFAATSDGAKSAPQTVTVTNTGNAALIFNSFSATANFEISAGATTCSTSSELQPGASCVVGVAFAPETTGTITGALAISDNAVNGNPQQIALSGTGLVSTTTSLTSAPDPSSGEQTVTFTITVTASNGSKPTGTATLYHGSTSIGSANLNASGVATVKTDVLLPGTNSMTATYNGSSSLPASTSAALSQVVTYDPTTTSLGTSPNPSSNGQSVTLTATVTPHNGIPPGGAVGFYNGTTLLGNANLSNGVATLSHAFATGTYSLKAIYTGSNYQSGSTSSIVTQTVQ